MKKIIIIGAGIAGLTAGIYGRLNGFETEIYELHSIPGGECTAWKRGGYTFDNCIDWLMGSKPGTPLNRLWRQVGALDDSVRIVNKSTHASLEMDGRRAVLYRSIDETEKGFIALSPLDEKRIRQFCNDARQFRRMQMPVEKPMDRMSMLAKMKLGFTMMPILGLMKKYGAITTKEFAASFQDPLLKVFLGRLLPEQYSAMPLLMMMSVLNEGDGGYPEGGSLPFALRIEKRYKALGGKVYYNSPVEKVLVENGTAAGIRLADGTERRADWVISSADGWHTLNRLLDGKYRDPKMQPYYDDLSVHTISTSVQVSLGIAADLSKEPEVLSVQPDAPLDAGGKPHTYVPIKNYSFDPAMAPSGKTTVVSLLSADYDWWKAKKADPQAYAAEKERIAREVCAVVEKRFPQAKGKIEQVDVATPVTYERYCNAWRGAWMSFEATPGGGMTYSPGKLTGLERFYMTGQWTMPSGGLPIALMTGRWTIQRICGVEKKKFTEA